MPELTVHTYDVPPALGRHLVLDPRTLAYRRRYTGDPIRRTEWEPKAPVLDQQHLLTQGIRTSVLFADTIDVDALASCTGNAATAALSVLHTTRTLADAGLDTTDPAAAEAFAIGLYAQATTRDQWHSMAWPSDDCGSSGLGVAKALRARGLIDQYGTATTAEELCMLLQTGPVLMGMPWHAAFSEPDPNGFIDTADGWDKSPVEGGHEVCITALETVATHDGGGLSYVDTILRARNSWSSSWGDHGEFRFSLALYQALRPEIDLVHPRLDTIR
ncbi:hypothetical protein [Streptomyces scabiei]|uniref:hypothetical protein n=1 Tax=Streptomyces scabiei TaxID=1930 RepID=UPI0038F6E419